MVKAVASAVRPAASSLSAMSRIVKIRYAPVLRLLLGVSTLLPFCEQQQAATLRICVRSTSGALQALELWNVGRALARNGQPGRSTLIPLFFGASLPRTEGMYLEAVNSVNRPPIEPQGPDSPQRCVSSFQSPAACQVGGLSTFAAWN